MNKINLSIRIKRKIKNIITKCLFQYLRIVKYKFLSDCKNIVGAPIYNQPAQLLGVGKIIFGNNVNLGVQASPMFYNGYGYIDARKEFSLILIGNDVWINNNFIIVSEGEGIEIGEKTMIGINLEITDTDSHDLHPGRRICGLPKTSKVIIGKNVFIGANVKILKGVVIGENSVIANSSVVTKSIPANVIAGGVPAKVIRTLDFS